MAFATYMDLQQAVAGWLNRADLTPAIPDFITLAEADMSRVLRVRDMLRRGSTTLGARFLTLPSGCREMKNLQLIGVDSGKDRKIDIVSMDQLDELREQYYSTAGIPVACSVVGNALEFTPVPATSYTVEMAYYESIPALSGTNATNWLLTKHPDLYLFGTLLQSAPYLHDDERIPVWAGGYDKVLAAIRMEDEHATYGGSALRIRTRVIE